MCDSVLVLGVSNIYCRTLFFITFDINSIYRKISLQDQIFDQATMNGKKCSLYVGYSN